MMTQVEISGLVQEGNDPRNYTKLHETTTKRILRVASCDLVDRLVGHS